MNSTIIMVHFYSNGVLVGRLVIGIYYGFLSTLPLAPSHLVSIRSLLLEDENEQSRTTGRPAVKGIFIAGVSGFMLAQSTMFLSVYYPPLYVAWFKPHLISLLLIPGLACHCARIFRFELVPLSHFGHPLLHPKMQITFWESFIFQLLNPFVLPNPVFTRLMSIYMFRYSDIPLLIAGNLLGWLSGQIVFMGLSYYLLVRFQKDSPTIYSITKRVIHWAFGPLMLIIIACSTGVMPLSHTANLIHKKKWKKLFDLSKWPDCFYLRDIPVRPHHYILSGFKSSIEHQTNIPFNKKLHKLQKSHYSEYFFDVCISDGQKRLAYTYPLSLSLIQEDLADITGIDLPNDDILYQNWIDDKRTRLKKFQEVINNKMFDLDQGASIENIIEKKLSSRHKHWTNKYYPLENIKDDMSKPTPIGNVILDSFPIYTYPPKIIRKIHDPKLVGGHRMKPIRNHRQSHWSKVINDKSSLITKQSSLITKRSYLTRWKLLKKRFKRLTEFMFAFDLEYTGQEGRKALPKWQSRYSSPLVTLHLELARSTLSRKRRRLIFYRSSARRLNYWKRRNVTGLRRLRQKKPRSWFFIRAKFLRKPTEKQKEKLKGQKTKTNTTSAVTVDLSYIHAIRGPVLVFQGFFRKFVKLPVAIMIKSIIRLLLLHSSEWFEDWKDWHREKHVYCLYSGETIEENEIYAKIYKIGWFGMHKTWLEHGLQVRIVFPLDVVPWRIADPQFIKSTDAKDKSNHTYLNIWGKQTYTLFGQIKQYEIFGPVKEVLLLILKKQAAKVMRVLYKYFLFVRKIYRIISSFFRKIFRKVFRVIRKIFKFVLGIFRRFASIFIRKKNKPVKESFIPTKDTLTANKESIQSQKLDKERSDLHPSVLRVNDINQLNKEYNSKVKRSKYTLQEQVPKIDFKIFDPSKFKIRLLPTKFIIKNKKLSLSSPKVLYKILLKYIKYQKIQIRFLRLQLYIKIRLLRRTFFRLIILSIRITKRGIKLFIRSNIKFIRYLLHVPTILKWKIKLLQLDYKYFKDTFFTKENVIRKNIINIFRKKADTAAQYDLSNAYILYSLWKLNRMTEISVTNLMMDWNPSNPLRDGLESQLKRQGILGTKRIEFMDIDCFEQWLKPFRRYTPHPDIWEKIAPTEWRDSMRAYWSKSNHFNMYIKEKILDVHEFGKKRIDNDTLDRTLMDNYFFSRVALSFHKPLFKKVAKHNKLWRLNLLYSRYLHSTTDFYLNDSEGWDADIRKENQEYRIRQVQSKSESDTQESNTTSENKTIIWGPYDTRYDVPGPYLPDLPKIDLNLDEEEEDEESALLMSPDKMPIHNRYEKIKSFYNRVRRPRRRLSFNIIRQYRWFNSRERKRARNARMWRRKMRYEINTIIDRIKHAVKKGYRKSHIVALQNIVKPKILKYRSFKKPECWYKVIRIRQARMLDDEVIMHSVISSLLRFKTRYLENIESNIFDPSIQSLFGPTSNDDISLTPEGIFSPENIREFRILECLDLTSEDNSLEKQEEIVSLEDKSNLSQLNLNSNLSTDLLEVSSNQFINRFIWPTHRVEDLACMNRFWFGTVNQGRFSNLRIRMYPKLKNK